MAIKKSRNVLNIAKVAHDAGESFVSPKPLPSNEMVRQQIVQTAVPAKPLKRVCTIEKTGGFSFFTTEGDRDALDYIAFRNKFEKQNVVRAALHEFIKKHYLDGIDSTFSYTGHPLFSAVPGSSGHSSSESWMPSPSVSGQPLN